MHIEQIEGFEALRRVQANWDAVYAVDPEAQFFMSWRWLHDWLGEFPSDWFVLAAKHHVDDEAYVAFLPLRFRTRFEVARGGFFNVLTFAGEAFSEYNGVLTTPEAEAQAVPAFAAHLKHRVNWAELKIDSLRMSRRRRALFLAPFDRLKFNHTEGFYRDAAAGVDHGVCPLIRLPDDWDAYLATLSANNRQKIRRLLRKLDAGEDDCRITLADAATLDRDLAILLGFWEAKWGAQKGKRLQGILKRNATMLRRMAGHGQLLLPVFWSGERPVAAFGLLLDPVRRAMLFLITGRDEAFDAVPAGYLLHAHCIRLAIAQGYSTYEFLRGDEPYKYLFAPQEADGVSSMLVATKTGRNLRDAPDRRGLEAMLAKALALEKAGEDAAVQLGYRQILDLAPDHHLALYRFGRLTARRGDHQAARLLLERSVAIAPDGDNAWFWLGATLHRLGEPAAALAAYRQTTRLNPAHAEAQYAALALSLGSPTPERTALSVLAARRPVAESPVFRRL